MSIIKALRAKTVLINVAELAALLRVNNSTVQRWARTQQIPCIKVGAVIRFDGERLADWMEARWESAHEDPDDYRMHWTDLGELAPEEFLISRDKQ
jgi:excisionase family DNA binding protein